MAALRPACVGLALGVAATAGAAGGLLDEASDLLAAGAPALALRLIQRHQPQPVGAEVAAWTGWERQRIAVYRAGRRWAQVVERLTARPARLPAAFERWAETQIADAHLRLGQGRAARARLLPLLWRSPEAQRANQVPGWRRMVIESYLLDGRVQDAYTAMLRHDLDYGDAAKEWRLLRARVLLRAGRTEEAARLTEDAASAEERALSLLARVSGADISAPDLYAEAKPLLDDTLLAAGYRYRLWAAVARRAARARSGFLRVRALEGLLALEHLVAPPRGLPALDADALWRAYIDHALQIGNAEQLLVGQHAGWLELARGARATEPVKARALYAYLARSAGQTAAGRVAERALVALHAASPAGAWVLRELYLGSRRFADPGDIPAAARYVLAEHALGELELELAARLMRGLGAPVTGERSPAWELRRARVLLLAGKRTEAVRLLRDILKGGGTFQPALLDVLIQILFDLQNAGGHAAAAGLFAIAAQRIEDPQRLREVLYWRADSLFATRRYEEAARDYMRSAMLPGRATMDTWAMRARQRAAESLARAGLVRDARGVYRALLATAREPGDRARLRRAMRRLSAPGAEREPR